jgi:C4-dicarboxylate transporter, DctQ subunit
LPGKVLDGILNVMGVLAGIVLLFITFSISYSIFTRFFGFQTPVWTVQFNEYALLWMTFLGTAWALRRQKHVSLDLIQSRLTPSARRRLEWAHSLVGILLCGVLCWYSAKATWSHFIRGIIDIKGIDVPKFIVISVIPFGFFLLILQFVRNLVSGSPETEEQAGDEAAEQGSAQGGRHS